MSTPGTPARLQQISDLSLENILIDITSETTSAPPGFRSLNDLRQEPIADTPIITEESLVRLVQVLCDTLSAVHSHQHLFLGFLSLETVFLNQDSTELRIVQTTNAIPDIDDDILQFGNVLLGLCVLTFAKQEHQDLVNSMMFTKNPNCFIPLFIPLLWRDTITRCTSSKALIYPSFAWIRDRITSPPLEQPPEALKVLDPFLYKRSVETRDLLNLLMNFKDHKIDTTAAKVLQSPIVQDDQLIETFIHYLIIAVFHRPARVVSILRLLNQVFSGLEPAKVALIKATILKMFPQKPASAGYWGNANAQMFFLYKGVEMGMFTPNEIVAMISDLWVGRDRYYIRRVTYHLFAYFAEIVEEYNKDLFEEIWEGLAYDPDKFFEGVSLFRHGDDLRRDNWRLLKAKRSDKDDIRSILAEDRISDLIERASHPSFNYDARIEPTLFEPVFMEVSRPTMLQYAAFYGSVQCFKHLLSSGVEEVEDDSGVSTFGHAVAGGNIEIVRLCEEANLSDLGAGAMAVRLHRPDIYWWLVSIGREDPILGSPTTVEGSVACNAAKTNYTAMILNAIEEQWDITSPDLHGYTPLMFASLFGYCDIMELLLSDPRVDPNFESDGGLSALHLAMNGGYIDAVRILLTHNVDLLGPEFPRLWHARSPEMIKVLIEAPNGAKLITTKVNGFSFLHVLCARGQRELLDVVAPYLTRADIEDAIAAGPVLPNVEWLRDLLEE